MDGSRPAQDRPLSTNYSHLAPLLRRGLAHGTDSSVLGPTQHVCNSVQASRQLRSSVALVHLSYISSVIAIVEMTPVYGCTNARSQPHRITTLHS